ncbi:MAG: DUF4403 family protein [Paludibacteraceae bacterium]
MKKKFYLFIILLLSLPTAKAEQESQLSISEDSLSQVITDSIKEERPEEAYEEIVYTPKISTLHIPIDINVVLLEKMLNLNFEGLIYEDNNIEDDSIMVKAWKEQDFKLQYENNVLTYRIPIKFWIKKRFGLGITYTDREIEGVIDIHLKTSINISKSWNLITKTDIENYSWIKKPTLKVGFMDIPITYFVDKIINDNRSLINKSIDKTLKEYVPIKTYAQNIWTSVQDPMDISTNGYKAWIKTVPKQIYTTPIKGDQGKISTTFGVKCLMEIFMGSAPGNITKDTQLPPLTLYAKADDKFAINILADVPYYVLDSVAKDVMIGQTFGEGKRSVVVDSIEIFGQNDKLIVGLNVVGFMNGKIYLECVPYYDPTSYSIRVKDVDYKLKTKNILAKIVNLFYKRGMKKKLEEELTFSLKDEYYLIKDMSRSELFNMEVVQNVKLDGFINDMNVDEIFIATHGLKVSLSLHGKLKVLVE